MYHLIKNGTTMHNERLQQLILKIHKRVFPFPKDWMDATDGEAGNLIKNKLNSREPCLIARFGSIEIEAIMAYLYRDTKMSYIKRFYNFASWRVRYQGWQQPLKSKLANNAGFFPTENALLNKFAELYLTVTPKIDILGSWIQAETLLSERMPNTKKIPLAQLEPYLSDSPWTKALEGKRVLVIHPFSESIEKQYKKREKLFKNKDVLPQFNLITLKSVQSAGGTSVPFPTWFDALDYMKTKVDKIEFDIAIIGAGAYGLPLAAHIKDIEKKAVHMGGVTQMLFGIYGQRWLDDPVRKKFISDDWVRPMKTETIKNAHNIENSCYW
jgi:hypothetical protein